MRPAPRRPFLQRINRLAWLARVLQLVRGSPRGAAWGYGESRQMNVEHVGTDSDRTLAVFAYILHLVGAVTGVGSIIALILNYVRRDRFGIWDTHHRWMIRSFWWGLLWTIIGACLIFVLVGY